MKLRKLPITKEPRLNVHKYVVAVMHRSGTAVMTKYFYCINLKEVRQRCEAMKKGMWCHVFKADHNFIKAYAKEN